MKKIICFMIAMTFLAVNANATLTVNNIPRTKVGSTTPTLQDSIITSLTSNVGIGTLTPTAVLDVNGKIQQTSDKIAVKPTTTVTVCASDARGKQACDYICTGTNDQVQINAALAYVNSLPYGGKVHLTEGHFSIDALIDPEDNEWLEGSGIDLTTLVGHTGLGAHGVIEDFTHSATDYVQNVSFTDFTIDGTLMDHASGYVVGRKGISVPWMNNGLVQRVRIINTPATCLATDQSTNTTLDNNILEGCGTAGQVLGSNGIGWGNTGTVQENPQNAIITNNIIKNVAHAGILFETQTGATTQDKNFVIGNNTSTGCAFGLQFSGNGYGVISNNIFTANTVKGVDFRTNTFVNIPYTDILFDGNLINDNPGDGADFGATQNVLSQRVIFSNNIVKGNGGEGLILYPNNFMVQGNLIDGNGLDGISFTNITAATNTNIQGNVIINNGQLGTSGKTYGIKISNTTSNITLDGLTIKNNTITDYQATKTQTYGIFVNNTGQLQNFDVNANFLDGNATGETNLTGVPMERMILTGGPGVSTFSGGVNVPTTSDIQSNGTRINYYLNGYGTGTAYSLTNSSAFVDMGTSDPSIILDRSGTYRLSGVVQLKYNAATFAANQTATCKITRVNNTAADVASASRTVDLRIITTVTDNAGAVIIPDTFYTTTNTSDQMQIYCGLSATPAAGSVDATSANITAQRMF